MFLDINKNFKLKAQINNRNITYSVYFENLSNESLRNVFFNFFIPQETELEKGSILINGEKVEDKFINGLRIKELPIQNKIEIRYTVKCLSLKDINISNKAKIKFDIDQKQNIEIYSNEVIVNISKKDDVMQKDKVLREFIDNNNISCNSGENIKYSTRIKNISLNYIDEIKIVLENNENIIFETQYIKIKDELKKIDIDKNIWIEELAPEEVVELHFNIRVIKDCTVSEIELKGNIEYTYINKNSGVMVDKLKLKPLKIKILDKKNEEYSDVKIFFNTNKNSLIKDDEIVYSSTIINTGNVATYLSYKLNVDRGLEENEGALINGSIVKGQKDIYNYKLLPGDGVNIEKKYSYKRSYGKEKLKAQGICNYRSNINGKEEEFLKKSEVVYVEVEPTVLKDFSIEESIIVSEVKTKIKDIAKVTIDIEIIDFYVIDIKRSTFESSEIVGKKSRFRGYIRYIIEYLSEENGEIINLFYKEKLFSNSLYLPRDYIDGELDEINIEVIDTYYRLIDNNKVYINSSLIAKTNL